MIMLWSLFVLLHSSHSSQLAFIIFHIFLEEIQLEPLVYVSSLTKHGLLLTVLVPQLI